MDKKPPPPKPPKKGKPSRPRSVTLGPVFNLEEHVPPDWWSRIFNSLYLKTDADVVDDAEITHTEIDAIIDILKLTPDMKILDLCCGQGRHTLELARRGFKNLEGLDRSHYLVQKAKESARSEGLNLRFREGDAKKLPLTFDTYDAVLILGNSFGYFESLQDDFKVLKEVIRVLKPWGKLLIDIADGNFLKNNFQRRSWEWIDKRMFVCRERSLSLYEEKLVSREVITHVNKGVLADQFYAERLYSRDSIGKLLKEAGFSGIEFPIEMTPDSKRGQDLGMMERRIIATAHIRKEWAQIRHRPKVQLKNVAVLMGDPRKPDKLKPQSVFDEDDFYTIDQLKAALREIKGCQFSYFDNHDTLIQDLSKLIGKTDLIFNLCDEGLLNDPRKEMHIPTLLDTLSLPYTGSAPQCLAVCYDKSLVRGAAKEIGVPVPEAFFINPVDMTFDLTTFDFPVIVKPNLGDSSFGITQKSVAYNAVELINAITDVRQKFGYEKPILVEEFLTGKDISVGIIGNPPSAYTVLPVTEEDYSSLPPELPKICGYEAKWCPDSPYWSIKSIPADLSPETYTIIIEWCVKMIERLECRDYVRLDWRLNSQGTPKLLEVNPNPGWCWDGHLTKMAAHADISYSDMLRSIIRAAFERYGIDFEQNEHKEAEKEKTTD